MRLRILAALFAVLTVTSCSNNPPAENNSADQDDAAPQAGQASSKSATAKSAPVKSAPATKTKFRPYDVNDPKQGLVVSRLAVPQGWKTSSRVTWNYGDFYMPVRTSARLESPDGSSWIEFFPAEFFLWLDPAHDRAPIGRGGIGGIHDPNITLPAALVRYVIGPNRAHMKNLRVLGYRPVKNLPAAFPKAYDPKQPLQGEGICMRVSYQLNGSPVDEEFYGFMTQTQVLTAPGPAHIHEYHRLLLMAHSMGAKSGKLESVRPLLGFVATSLEPNPAWQQRLAEVKKQQGQYYDRIQAYNRREVQAAGQRSRQLTAQSNQFMAQIDANLAASRAQQAHASFSSSSTEDFYKRADDFDQNIRGTEHMVDQNGEVSDQSNAYNYHWTDGYGTYVHSNDPNFDPNRYLTGSYEQMTPAPR
jgi:hypothetical protein